VIRNEAVAWRRIAAKVDKEGLRASGLCAEVTERPDIGWELRTQMLDRIAEHLAGPWWFEGSGDYAYGQSVYGPHPADSERAQNRVTMALFLAAEAESEATA
jgi:hypothetical protein